VKDDVEIKIAQKKLVLLMAVGGLAGVMACWR
jgi:hypothetical protein